MKKIIYVGRYIEKTASGGDLGTSANQRLLKTIFEDNFKPFYLSQEKGIKQLFNRLVHLYYPGVSNWNIRKLKSFIAVEKPDYVFFDTAQYGRMIKKVRKAYPEVKICTYFHNVELLYAKSYLSIKRPKSWFFYHMTKVNEKDAVEYSDYLMPVTDRDGKTLEQIYGRKTDFTLLFNMINRLTPDEIYRLKVDNSLISRHEALFVGTNFWGNTDGLKWFIKEILPQLDIKLVIVGKGMSDVFKSSGKVEVHDFVEDLAEFYEKADFVILPITSGAGMKTKTAEAMMYGKTIIATGNALEGYDYKGIKGIYKCDTKEEIKNAVKQIYTDKIHFFNEEIYDNFVLNYSTESMSHKLRKFFDNIEKQ